MAEQSRHWTGTTIGDATLAPYSASKWADQERLEHGQGAVFPNYGVLQGTGDGTYPPLRTQATSPASAQIEIRPGSALVHGYLYENSSTINLTVGANASGNPRIDTVILRIDFVAQTIRAILKQGTPAASPVHPSLQQDTSIWEIPLVDVAVANGFATITNADITPRGRSINALTRGWMPYAYPLDYIIGGNYDASPIGVTTGQGFAVPITLSGNMSLQDVVMRHVSGNVTLDLQWGLYIQDTNDGETAENTLRLVASGSTSGLAVTAPTNIVIAASPAPVPLSPGLYWLVVRSSGGGTLSIGRIVLTPFQSTASLFNAGTAFTIGQTLDLVTGWAANGDSYAIRLRGRVRGQTTVF